MSILSYHDLQEIVISPTIVLQTMKPTRSRIDPQNRLFDTRLEDLCNLDHELVLLADRIAWSSLEDRFEPLYADVGRPGIPIRMMAGLTILQSLYSLSEDAVVDRWSENPYWQYLVADLNSGIETCDGYEGEHTDWRLPNRNEQLTLADYSGEIDAYPFENRERQYWTSTSLSSDSSQAWYVDFPVYSYSNLSGSFYDRKGSGNVTIQHPAANKT
ncbi:MAG: DUF1566 domain-containing protein [Magnetococcales bacterium]|nr:DUF1566 domain-containing protein [Magnetococcales bacterium]